MFKTKLYDSFRVLGACERDTNFKHSSYY